MDLHLVGKVAVITGGSGGIGIEIGRAMLVGEDEEDVRFAPGPSGV